MRKIYVFCIVLKFFYVLLWTGIGTAHAYFGPDLKCWIREAEKQVCRDPKQCKRYIALSPIGRAVVLQTLLRRNQCVYGISEIQLVTWILKEYQGFHPNA